MNHTSLPPPVRPLAKWSVPPARRLVALLAAGSLLVLTGVTPAHAQRDRSGNLVTSERLAGAIRPLDDQIRSLREELSRLQRDSIDLQKLLLSSGFNNTLGNDLQRQKTQLAAMQDALNKLESRPGAPASAGGGSVGATEIRRLEDELGQLRQDLAAVQSRVAAAGGAPSAPALPGAPAAAPGAAAPLDLSALKALADSQTTALNIVWTLVTGFLVMFMQAGFAMVETGFTRAKNVAHTMSMNFMVYALGMLGFWAFGFGLMFGGTGAATSVSTVTTLGTFIPEKLNSEWGFAIGGKFFGLLGGTGYFLPPGMLEGGLFSLFLFQMVFMDTTATIPTGAMAERWRFLPFCIYAVLVGALIYPVFGNWVWGGGWLAALGKNFGLGHGHVDFAGSSVVHLCGGAIAYAGSRILGPREGKFNADGSPNPIPGHNIPMGIIGTFILAFGWFGFNPGSTLAGADTQIGVIAVNTMLASAAGALTGMATTWVRYGRPDPSFMCNGMLAGLVAITAPCAFVESWAAVFIGLVAGVLVVYAAEFIETRLRIDDPVGAISVHGVNGAWGVISLGLLANGRYGDGWNGVAGKVTGMFYGDFSQLVAECIGALVCFFSVFGMAHVVFRVIGRFSPHRPAAADEIIGLDEPEMGVLGYQNEAAPMPVASVPDPRFDHLAGPAGSTGLR